MDTKAKRPTDAGPAVALITAHGWIGASMPVLTTAKYLARKGFFVDLFVSEDPFCNELGLAPPPFEEPNISIHTHRKGSRQSIDPRIVRDYRHVEPVDLEFASCFLQPPRRYDWIVGFDPRGLIRAGVLSSYWQVPFLYHSLEITEEENHEKLLERQFASKALLTLIQDDARADILARLNGSDRSKFHLIYNSSFGDLLPQRSDYLRTRLGIPASKKIVMAIGTLLPIHSVDKIVDSVPLWPEDFVLVLHGWFPDQAFKNRIFSIIRKNPGRIYVSSEILHFDRRFVIFQSTDIGLVFFEPVDTNLEYSGGSAGKLYDFMRTGIPIIGNDIPGMVELLEGNRCGLVVKDSSELGETLPKIMEGYNAFRRNCLTSFHKYDFGRSYDKLLQRLYSELLPAASPSATPAPTSAPTSSRNPQGGLRIMESPAAALKKEPCSSSQRPQYRDALKSEPVASRVLQPNREAPPADPEFRHILQIVRPYTLLAETRLHSLFNLAKAICQKDIPGNIIVSGMSEGGSIALLAYIVKRYSRTKRTVFAFDNLEGMHRGLQTDSPARGTDAGAAPRQNVAEICARLKVSDIVHPVKGSLPETLPGWRDRIGMIAMLHMNGGRYESTRLILKNLYERMVNDSMLQVDDYGHEEGCRRALHEFEQERHLRFAIKPIDETGVWFAKPDRFPLNPALPEALVREYLDDDPVSRRIESQMSSNERFQVYDAIRRHLPGKATFPRFIEIGSYSGASLYLMHNAFRRRSSQMQGFAVEPEGTPQFYSVMRAVHPDVTHLKMYSFEAAPLIHEVFSRNGKLADLILVDGDHGYEGVRNDILSFYPLLAPGGLMIFHDYLPVLDERNREAIFSHHAGNEPGIRRACHELMEASYGCEVVDLPLLYPTDPGQTQAYLPIIPGVFSTIRTYRKPA